MAATLSKATLSNARVPLIVLPPVFETSGSVTGPRVADDFWNEIKSAIGTLA
jgi:hypothetical protein